MAFRKAKRIDEVGAVKSNREVAPGFYKMTVESPKIAKRFAPGQFFQIRVSPTSDSPLLRRPFAPSQVEGETFSFIYQMVGEGTEAMTRLKPGAEAGILGPLGNGYKLPRKGMRAVLVGGGCGTPSLRLLGEVLTARGVEVFSVIGAQTACTLLEKSALKRISTLLAVATDDGSAGVQGHAVAATEILLNEIGEKPTPQLFACGPYPMLKGLTALARMRDLRLQVSLEERMACGFGACMGCAVPIVADNEDGFVYQRVCADGPVFDAREVVW